MEANNDSKIKKVALIAGIVLVVGLLLWYFLVINNDDTDSDMQDRLSGLFNAEDSNGEGESTHPDIDDSFPEAVPLYQPSVLVSSTYFEPEEDEDEIMHPGNWRVSFVTDQNLSEVTSYYENAFGSSGWEVISTLGPDEHDDSINITAYNAAESLEVTLWVGDQAMFSLYVLEDVSDNQEE